FPGAEAELRSQRDLIQKLDTLALSAPHTKQRFVIGEEVRLRLLKFNRLDATVLHQASTMTGYRSGEYEYVFMPGRLHRWKRVDLVVRAMQHVEADVELRIAGGGEDEKAF